MLIARYRARSDEPARIGVVEGDTVRELPGLDGETDVGVLVALDEDRSWAAAAADTTGTVLPLAEVELLAPLRRPPKFLGIGLNYTDHVDETGRQRPEFPIFFNKQSTCVTGPHADVEIPAVVELVDYEGELGLVIGRRCRNVAIDEASEVIAGYLVVNDVTARDWQYKAPTWTLGKSFDTHGPIGPWLVTADALDPHALRIRTYVNGDLRQDAQTSEMLYSCFEQVSTLSTVFTLEPGDLVATGTPAGVGMARNPPEFLADGDVVRIEIEGIGSIENRFVAVGRSEEP